MNSYEVIVIPKTIEGLRDALFDEINSLRSGQGNLQQARAIAQLSAQAIDYSDQRNERGPAWK
jgi:hypothetical protein